MAYKVKINRNWQSQVENGLADALAEIVVDIDKRAKILTPILSGNLVNSQRIERISPLAYRITSGGEKVPYGRRQYFENKTKSRWLEKAADAVFRGNISKYFRNKGL